MNQVFRTPEMVIQLSEAGNKEIQLFRVGTFYHASYGKFEITKEILQAMEKNFQAKVRGIDLAVDYKHASDAEAAGWIKSLYLLNEGTELWASVDWTPKADKILSEKEFRYISPEFTFDYQDNETLQKYGPVLLGAGLTNRPTIKNMEPVVLSESPIPEKIGKKEVPSQPQPKKKEIKAMENLDQLSPEALEKMSPEEMKALCVQLIAALKKPAAPAEGELAEAKKKLADLEAKCAAMESEKKLAEKKGAFVKLLSEGKVCAAQEQAYLAGDFVKFAELSQSVNLSEKGNSQEVAPSQKDEQDEIIALAEAKMKADPKMKLDHAISLVLSEKPELAKKIYG
jgi:phage I-like protein